MFWLAKISFKKDSNDYIINNLWFSVIDTVLHNLQEKNRRFCLRTRFFVISNKSMPKSTQQIKKIDLNYYVTDHQWFMFAFITLCNFQKINSHNLLTKILPAKPMTDY